MLFDSDGVLVDSHLDGHRAWFQLADEFDFDLDDEVFGSLAGIRPSDSLARFVNRSRLTVAIARLEDLEVDLAATTLALPGAHQLVNSIPDDRWAIVTSASRRLGCARWDGAELPAPRVIVASEDVVNGKPDPEPYRNAAAQLGVDIERCLVFEDSPGGGQAGLAAGAQVVAVGGQDWPGSPVARVSSLAEVGCTVTDDGLLAISIRGS